MPRNKLFSVTIKDCRVETFTCSGNGGQHRNSTQSGVRITHLSSGATGWACDEREQLRNKRLAWSRMANDHKFILWAKLEAQRIMGRMSPEELVEQQMAEENLKVEIKDENGRWIATSVWELT